jgi:four helix bundle protein
MFDFEKLDLYQEIRITSSKLFKWVNYHPTLDETIANRFKIIITGIAAELAEGTARLGYSEKKKHYTDARVLVFEAVTLLHLLKDIDAIAEDEFEDFYNDLDKISRMLLGMIRSQRKDRESV